MMLNHLFLPLAASKTAESHHRHTTSLEAIINFTPNSDPPLTDELRRVAQNKFENICQYVDELPSEGYSRSELVRQTYKHARSEKSQDIFLHFVFQAIELPIDGEEPFDVRSAGSKLVEFAECLFNYFFLPLKASAKKTPQPSPAFSAAIQKFQGHCGQEYTGTESRLSLLRSECLQRDRHRCVISRRFHFSEYLSRKNNRDKYPRGAEDDDGVLVLNHGSPKPALLEVAHILPRSLVKLKEGTELDESKQYALGILSMFDVDVAELINGTDIDRPRNAISLTQEFHDHFGNFRVYFTKSDEDHKYEINSYIEDDIFEPSLPVTRKLFLTPDRTIEPPSPRLLELHYAISRILHMSGAGEHIDKILRDAEETGVAKEDGATPLGVLVSLHMRTADGVPA
ncbi:hypothetical protein SAMD00023353_12300090 [Rosellinia necatrix]|uniref:HNH nuclease domain-containing protein n=1 Tax=Rosellinia necatrix TaxID=77044 RepID=A0A1W2TAE5_ROSNE|nr:hypothetical protein SAMD00023353_12300090 [Rosellinia necatrix]